MYTTFDTTKEQVTAEEIGNIKLVEIRNFHCLNMVIAYSNSVILHFL